MNIKVTRAKLEALVDDLIGEETGAASQVALLRDLGLLTQINDVILVGEQAFWYT